MYIIIQFYLLIMFYKRQKHYYEYLDNNYTVNLYKLDKETQTKINVSVKAIQTEVNTINKAIQTEVNTINKAIQTEVNTINKAIQTEVKMVDNSVQTYPTSELIAPIIGVSIDWMMVNRYNN